MFGQEHPCRRPPAQKKLRRTYAREGAHRTPLLPAPQEVANSFSGHVYTIDETGCLQRFSLLEGTTQPRLTALSLTPQVSVAPGVRRPPGDTPGGSLFCCTGMRRRVLLIFYFRVWAHVRGKAPKTGELIVSGPTCIHGWCPVRVLKRAAMSVALSVFWCLGWPGTL